MTLLVMFWPPELQDIKIICMSYGYNHGNDIRDAGPDIVIDSMAELINYL